MSLLIFLNVTITRICQCSNAHKINAELLWAELWLYLNLRSSEIHLFYNLGDFYWHFLEILWLFIFLFLYSLFLVLWSSSHLSLLRIWLLCFASLRIFSGEKSGMNLQEQERVTLPAVGTGSSCFASLLNRHWSHPKRPMKEKLEKKRHVSVKFQ